jgi:hypothetical protein
MVTSAKGPPGHRVDLLYAVVRFVEAASRCPGVRRIALMGSLATDKVNPGDADVLVTVTDEADLAPLARAGRRLKGAAQSLNLGGDIFLANMRGEYIGRTCHWRRCGPGIRVSCRAQHCGRRPFLNDDLQVLSLDDDLVERPPIELWPSVERRASVPGDVEELVISMCARLGKP